MSREAIQELFDQGMDFLEREKLEDAHQCFKRCFEIDPERAEGLPGMESNYGFTLAMVGGRERRGLFYIHKGIKSNAFRSDGFLNLGKFYLYKKRNRKKALNAFYSGLRQCPSDPKIIKIIQEMGTRQKPIVRFLSRNNSLNRWLGKRSAARK